ncbi:MAG: hypothetical protein LBH21_07035, partial [Gracilibacteraceae bacterium]|nr:hypothetical protein [Gracilibacteraceae bacterium]
MPDNIAGAAPAEKTAARAEKAERPPYESTRGLAPPLGAAAAITAGIAPDGGLYAPRRLP